MKYYRFYFLIMALFISQAIASTQDTNDSNTNNRNVQMFFTLYHQHHNFFNKAFSYQGIETGVVVQNKVYFGFYGAFFASNLKTRIDNETRYVWMGQGGINTSYVFLDEKRFCPGIQLDMGYFTLRYDADKCGLSKVKDMSFKLNGLVFSPQIFGEVHLNKWFQVRTGLSYNFYEFEDHTAIKTSDLNHISFTVGLSFRLIRTIVVF